MAPLRGLSAFVTLMFEANVGGNPCGNVPGNPKVIIIG
jgi:hypothetical protein